MSNKIALVPDEQVVLSSGGDILVLTTKRVRYDSVVWGRSNLISITLDSVASCGLVTRSYPLLLLLAAVAFVVAFTQPNDVAVFIVASIILVIAYFLTRRAVISIASNGGQAILAPTKGMKREVAIGFIDAVEREKLK